MRANQPWHLVMINKPATLSGAGVSVGIVDYGFNPHFPDLDRHFAPVCARYTDPPSSSRTPGGMAIYHNPSDRTRNSHGSKVCTMLAGKTNGVAPKATVRFAAITTPDVIGARLMMITALDWLLTTPTGAHPDRPIGCDIITTSLQASELAKAEPDGPLEAALEAAAVWRTIVVAAVGNGGAGNPQAPASSQHVIAVGAVDSARNVADFSASGSPTLGVTKPDLVAPGERLLFPNGMGGHNMDSGTSFAAPIVAGAAALIMEKRPSLRTDVERIKEAILTFTSNSTSKDSTRSGRGVCDLTGL